VMIAKSLVTSSFDFMPNDFAGIAVANQIAWMTRKHI